MSSCCETSDTPLASKANLTVALAGNPNCGKTTIFNALTGLKQKVANYPGVTVEKKTGRCKLEDGTTIDLVDLPGTYSLISRSPDEQVAMEVLRGLRPDTPAPDAVIVVVDASNLQRNLYLVSQLVELGRPMVVALNMMDIAERRGLRISAERLQLQLGVPVVAVVGHRREGIEELKKALKYAAIAPMPDWNLPDAMKEELVLVGGGLAILDSSSSSGESGVGGRVSGLGTETRNPRPETRFERYAALAERLLIGDRAADIEPYAALQPVDSLLSHATRRLEQLGIDPMQSDIEAHYHWIDQVAAGSLIPACEVLVGGTGASPVQSRLEPQAHVRDGRATVLPYESRVKTFTDSLDRILLHKVWGLAIFALVMAGLFVSIFLVADPIMGATESFVGWLGGLLTPHLPEGPLRDLWTDGIIAGVGAVVVFIPQIAILFGFLSILEDSGYLARAAFLMDRLLAKVGLHGKSFIPLLSSFACAIPGIMAARTIENRRDRLATIFIAPFMSCSARIPVYALLIKAFFSQYSAFTRGGIMMGCYVLGIVAAVFTAWIFKKTFMKSTPAAFILELPTYKRPQGKEVLRQVLLNTWAFIAKAGTTIFCLSVILWAMTYYPRLPESQVVSVKRDAGPESKRQAYDEHTQAIIRQETKGAQLPSNGTDRIVFPSETKVEDWPWPLDPSENARAEELIEEAVASAQLRHSFAGRLGHAMEPVIKPLGFDWKMGVGLVGAFAAREVFVSTMGIVYSAGDVEDDTSSLADTMRADHYDNGKPVWTPLVATSLLIWFVLAMQCMSTLAIVRRETGGWKWPVFMLAYMNGLAYVVCLLVFQIGKHL
jgi:ferrous iron transport protein B